MYRTSDPDRHASALASMTATIGSGRRVTGRGLGRFGPLERSAQRNPSPPRSGVGSTHGHQVERYLLGRKFQHGAYPIRLEPRDRNA